MPIFEFFFILQAIVRNLGVYAKYQCKVRHFATLDDYVHNDCGLFIDIQVMPLNHFVLFICNKIYTYSPW